MRFSLLAALLAVTLLGILVPTEVRAFCGFYVANASQDLHNPATAVVLMRDGTRTVLSMENHYEGPPQDFAMVVPVPVVLSRDDVRTLPAAVFDRVDQLDAPRLVEYWEQDPCARDADGEGYGHGTGLGLLGTLSSRSGGGLYVTVRVEARFAVGEYDVVMLSATDSTGLKAWLRHEHYAIPPGAAALFEPYVRAGSKFFVARVDVRRVRFEHGRARLSPLRFHYDSDTFSLPIRLGLINSPGAQDLVVHVLARSQRYDVANRENLAVPTNLDVVPSVRGAFGGFYASLFDRVMEQHPAAVVTEYAWQSSRCDPCPVDPLTTSELMTLGADVLPSVSAACEGTTVAQAPTVTAGSPTVSGPLSLEEVRRSILYHRSWLGRACNVVQPGTNDVQVTLRWRVRPDGAVESPTVVSAPSGASAIAQCMAHDLVSWRFPSATGSPTTVTDTFTVGTSTVVTGPGATHLESLLSDFVLTRLHTRYGRDAAGDDLVFRAVPPLSGGREHYDDHRQLEHGAVVGSAGPNNFQARYVIRHEWQGPVACPQPTRGVWGPPPGGPGTAPGSAASTAAPPTAFATRSAVPLSALLRQPVPDLGLPMVVPIRPSTALPPTGTPPVHPAAPVHRARCDVGGVGARPGGPLAALALAGAVFPLRRRRRGRTPHGRPGRTFPCAS